VKKHINPLDGLDIVTVQTWVEEAKLNPQAHSGAVDIILKLYKCYTEGDADLVEINPMILATDGKVYALDAKVSLNDAAAYRHPEWEAFTGLESLDERERLAKEKGLQYVGLDGSVGIIANGAGLAMSTLDVVQQVGGQPANFLDVGGGANADVVTNALNVINTDPNVEVIFINIFGGITRCDEVANGIITAMQRVDLQSPLVVRLDGTNSEEGRQILDAHQSDQLIRATTMVEAAKKAVEVANSRQEGSK
jgi:succinyl-CoA synthetase beta subunit